MVRGRSLPGGIDHPAQCSACSPGHVSLHLAGNRSTFGCGAGGKPLRPLGMAVRSHSRIRARWNDFDQQGWNELDRTVKWREGGGERVKGTDGGQSPRFSSPGRETLAITSRGCITNCLMIGCFSCTPICIAEAYCHETEHHPSAEKVCSPSTQSTGGQPE